MNTKKRTRITINDIFVYALFLAIVLVATIVNSNFFTVANFMTIAKQTATVAVVAFGMTFVITCGMVDLSIYGQVAMTGMIVAVILNDGGSILVATVCGLLCGIVVGITNGVLIAKIKLAPFLATLGTGSICEGIAKTITNQQVVTLYSEDFANFWGRAKIFTIPCNILWMFLFFAIAVFLYHFTTFGNHVKAVGGNSKAALFSGVKNDKIIITVMLISGICASLSGIMYVSRVNQGRPDVGTTTGMDAITGTVLGKTAFTGGKGSMVTSLFGAFVILTMTNAMVIMGIPTTAQLIVKGVIIIVAVSLSARDIVIYDSNKKNVKGEV